MKLLVPQLRTILHLNGIDPNSPPEQIMAVMQKANYTENEYKEALAQLKKESPDSAKVVTVPAYRVDAAEPDVPTKAAPPKTAEAQYTAPLTRVMESDTPSQLLLKFQKIASYFAGLDIFHGRISMVDFWIAFFILVLMLIPFTMVMIGIALLFPLVHIPVVLVLTVLGILGMVAASVMLMGLLARRLHDIDREGWIAPLIFLVCIIIKIWGIENLRDGSLHFTTFGAGLLYLSLLSFVLITFLPGNKKPNAYGMTILYTSPWAAFIGRKPVK